MKPPAHPARNLKIGVVIERLQPSYGGAERWTNLFVRWLVRSGHAVHLIVRELGDRALAPLVTCDELGNRLSRLSFASAAAERLRGRTLDVAHDMGPGSVCDVFQPHGGSRRALCQQMLLLDSAVTRFGKRWLHSWLPRYRDFEILMAEQYNSDRRVFVALSKMVAKHFQELHGVPASQIRLIYNGVDTQHFSPEKCAQLRTEMRGRLGLGADDLVLLHSAHNMRLKGLPTLIRATSRLRTEGHPIRLLILGRRSTRYERLSRRHGLGQHAQFPGWVEDASAYYAAADACVQPTFYDPCSLVTLEALACGLPVITSRFNGMSELMASGREGFVMYDPGNVTELVTCIRQLADRGSRAAMSARARRLAEAHTLDSNFQALLRVYEEPSPVRKAA